MGVFWCRGHEITWSRRGVDGRNPAAPGMLKNLVTNGINWINYQLQLVSLPDFRTINSNFEWFARKTSTKRFFGLVSYLISPVAGRYESNPSPFKQLAKTRWHHRSLAEAGDPASFWNGTFSGVESVKVLGCRYRGQTYRVYPSRTVGLPKTKEPGFGSFPNHQKGNVCNLEI